MKILGMGMPELLIILAVVFLIFGPKQLPKLGSALGKTMKSLREGLGSNDETQASEEEIVEIEEAEEEPVKKAQPKKKAAQKPAQRVKETTAK